VFYSNNMKLDDLPDLNSVKLSERITIPVTPEMREAVMNLKMIHKKDAMSWLRSIIERELKSIKPEKASC
jgi:hypothetical protein